MDNFLPKNFLHAPGTRLCARFQRNKTEAPSHQKGPGTKTTRGKHSRKPEVGCSYLRTKYGAPSISCVILPLIYENARKVELTDFNFLSHLGSL